MRACLNLYIINVMATIFSRIIAGEIPSYKAVSYTHLILFAEFSGTTVIVQQFRIGNGYFYIIVPVSYTHLNRSENLKGIVTS